jgi:hypothetical protein
MNETEKILYHYSSLEGLIGIIESKSIWATNILYLNDASELNYAKGLFRNQVNHFERKKENEDYLIHRNFKTLIEDMENSTSKDTYAFFVCSFSEENDLLSQWRGYSPKGIGLSLGFKLGDLRKSVERYAFSIRPCIYNKNEQLNEINKLIEKNFIDFTNEKRQYQHDMYRIILNKSGLVFYVEFLRLAPSIKHPKFIEEQEWRIVARVDTKDQIEMIRYRPGKSMIIPYIEIPLPRGEDNLIINKIVVGPTHDPELAKDAVEMLLKSKKVKFDEIEVSTIPYRNW